MNMRKLAWRRISRKRLQMLLRKFAFCSWFAPNYEFCCARRLRSVCFSLQRFFQFHLEDGDRDIAHSSTAELPGLRIKNQRGRGILRDPFDSGVAAYAEGALLPAHHLIGATGGAIQK